MTSLNGRQRGPLPERGWRGRIWRQARDHEPLDTNYRVWIRFEDGPGALAARPLLNATGQDVGAAYGGDLLSITNSESTPPSAR